MYLQRNDGSVYFAYNEEERQQVKAMSLTGLASFLGFTPVQKGQHYSLKEMDSLIIYDDRTWNRFSGKGNINSGSTIDFMMEFGGAGNVPEAIQKLLEIKGNQIQTVRTCSLENADSSHVADKKEMTLPPKNDNYRRMYAYLMQTRGLSQDVVSDFVHRRLIYEEANHHNIVFCGYDPDGVVRYAGMRGTADIYGKKFKCDVPGNDKNYGVNIVNKNSTELKVFESVIDCMSYIDMTGDRESNKLVLGMVEDNPLERFLKDYSHIKKITFCLDNDEAGKKAIYGTVKNNGEIRQGLGQKYMDLGYEVGVDLPSDGKDFNEQLLNKKKENFHTNKLMTQTLPEMDVKIGSFYDGDTFIYQVHINGELQLSSYEPISDSDVLFAKKSYYHDHKNDYNNVVSAHAQLHGAKR